ncbi:hypothetical protein [Desulfosporosinus sp. BICA1-9]|nr:hypothetical protein [Desulfosporosinus sp. BICA1-9]
MTVKEFYGKTPKELGMKLLYVPQKKSVLNNFFSLIILDKFF